MTRTTLSECIQSPPLANYRDTEALEVKIGELIQWLDLNVTTSLKLTEEQIAFIAYGFIEDFPVESLEDIGCFVKKAARGEFKHKFSFTALDGITIFTWFREYLDLKYAEREKLWQKQKKAPDAVNDDLLTLPARAEPEQRAKILAARTALCEKFAAPKEKVKPRPVAPSPTDEQYRQFRKAYLNLSEND